MTKILVIEDEEAVRNNILDIIEVEGYESIGAENGRIGIELAKKHLPDLIICDILMPELNGYGVIEALRSEPRTQNIPFIFLTARAAKEDMRKGMKYGADDYLTKPFEIDDLLAAIEARLERHAISTKQIQELRMNVGFMLPHELRTPLTSILGFSQFLMDPETLPDAKNIAMMATSIYESGLRLQSLIQNYLMFVELSMLDHQPEKRKLWRGEEALPTKTIISFFTIRRAKEWERKDDLVLELSDVSAIISEESLKKIIEELFDNALKFSEKGTPIIVKTEVVNNEFVLSITDHGRGMKQDQIENIGAFVQFDRKKYEQQGSGLGLAIVLLLVEINGGRLEIESIPGEKTTVKVYFKTI